MEEPECEVDQAGARKRCVSGVGLVHGGSLLGDLNFGSWELSIPGGRIGIFA